MQKLILVTLVLFSLINQTYAGTASESTVLINGQKCNGISCDRTQATGVAVHQDKDYTYIITAAHSFSDPVVQVSHFHGNIKGQIIARKGLLALVKVQTVAISTVCVADDISYPTKIITYSHEKGNATQKKRTGQLASDNLLSFGTLEGSSGSGVFDSNGDLVGIIESVFVTNTRVTSLKAIKDLLETKMCFKLKQRRAAKAVSQIPKTVEQPKESIPPPAEDKPPVPPPVDENQLLARIKELKDQLDQIPGGLDGLKSDITGLGQNVKGLEPIIKNHKPDLSAISTDIKALGNKAFTDPSLGTKLDKIGNLATWGLGLAALIGIPGLGCIPFVLKGLKAAKVVQAVHQKLHPTTQVIIPGAAVPGTMRTVEDTTFVQPEQIDAGLLAFQEMKKALVSKVNVDPQMIHQMDALFNQFHSGFAPKKS